MKSLQRRIPKVVPLQPPARANPLVGYVISSGLMSKTVKVRIPRTVVVPKYGKRMTRYTILLVHDAEEQCDVGDKVELLKSRPYSKRKHHIVSQILVKDPATAFLQANPQYARTRQEIKASRLEKTVAEADYKKARRVEQLEAETAKREARAAERAEAVDQREAQVKAEEEALARRDTAKTAEATNDLLDDASAALESLTDRVEDDGPTSAANDDETDSD